MKTSVLVLFRCWWDRREWNYIDSPVNSPPKWCCCNYRNNKIFNSCVDFAFPSQNFQVCEYTMYQPRVCLCSLYRLMYKHILYVNYWKALNVNLGPVWQTSHFLPFWHSFEGFTWHITLVTHLLKIETAQMRHSMSLCIDWSEHGLAPVHGTFCVAMKKQSTPVESKLALLCMVPISRWGLCELNDTECIVKAHYTDLASLWQLECCTDCEVRFNPWPPGLAEE